jgi:hypothetical protein
MKTEDLIGVLAASAGPAPRAPVARRLAPAALLGLAVAVSLAVAGFGLLPAGAFDAGAFTKLAYAGALASAAGWLASRHARPAMPTAAPWLLVALVAAAMVALGAASLWQAPAGERVATLFGQYWLVCPWAVFALSLPALAASLWALRGLAPTRPRLAGLSAGLLAGALGALGYALTCPESAAAFVAAWYSLGVLLTGLAGALLGPRVLRW